jgi:hypothetical protein
MKILPNLNFNLVTMTLNDKNILEYNHILINRFIYIISIAVKFITNMEMVQLLINKYLSKIIKYGNTYDIINACLLSFHIKFYNKNIKINYDYYKGLIMCLDLSPRWNEHILYFHNKQLINKFNIQDVFAEIIKYLFNKTDEYSLNIMTNLLGDKSDFIITNKLESFIK